nr:reverse transcriptase domain-containing protein [Tanacetum cinerariifolium]
PKTLQESIELENDLMDQNVRAYADRLADNKRRMDNSPGDNHDLQPPYKNAARAYTARPSEKKKYVGTLPLCNKCKLHHNESCTIKTLTCFECGNQGHYHSECPRLKSHNCGNQTGNDEAHERMYPLGGGETDQDHNNIADDIEA